MDHGLIYADYIRVVGVTDVLESILSVDIANTSDIPREHNHWWDEELEIGIFP